MNATPGTLQGFFDRWTEPVVLAQLLVLVVALAAALITTHAVHRWQERARRSTAPTSWRTRLVEGMAMQSGSLAALVLILAARAALASGALDTGVLDTAMQLLAALMLVRLAVHLLHLLLGERSWLRNWEQRITLGVWLIIAFELLGWFSSTEGFLDAIDLLPGKAHFSLWALLKGLVVVGGFVIVASVVARAIEQRVMRLENVAVSTRIGITKFTYFFLVGLGILLGVNAAGVDLTALTVLTGAIGLGLGFGLQAITSNFVSGFVLLMDKSIKPGDVISFTGHTGTSTENFGWVEELRGRYVVVRDRDGVETLVPNQHLITNPVINWSYSDRRVRLKLPVRISYRDDPELALETLLRATSGHPRVLHDPAPVSRLMQFGEAGMDLELRFWIADPQNGVNNVRSDVNREIWRLFRAAGVTIPVAQREVFLYPAGEFLPPREPPPARAPGEARG
ncbi:MAG: mechanosensitive ion channel [Gammaproteobacteria bacterium]|nr:mechanosensitive ion channel [Gammaproteobacteria bacterium]